MQYKIDGRALAEQTVRQLVSLPKPKKFIGVFLVGSNPSSLFCVRQKEKTAKLLGIDYRLYKFNEDISQDDLRKEVGRIARHSTCGGVVVQLPLPEHINRHYVLNAIPPQKDLDVLSERSLG